ncbi:hypothetical protein SDC9_162088 [bioreactor metagenome]|uniref:Uncharacterized protein n=1 Tax=bioreactor metagenome TaxID=1076179 RepID=A0A645FN48_9ZZZZ
MCAERRAVYVYAKPDNMQLAAKLRIEFNAWNDSDAEPPAFFDCFFDAAGGVMVSQRHHRKAGFVRFLHKLGGRERTVGHARVRMQVKARISHSSPVL